MGRKSKRKRGPLPELSGLEGFRLRVNVKIYSALIVHFVLDLLSEGTWFKSPSKLWV
jgi:hypothetical protein